MGLEADVLVVEELVEVFFVLGEPAGHGLGAGLPAGLGLAVHELARRHDAAAGVALHGDLPLLLDVEVVARIAQHEVSLLLQVLVEGLHVAQLVLRDLHLVPLDLDDFSSEPRLPLVRHHALEVALDLRHVEGQVLGRLDVQAHERQLVVELFLVMAEYCRSPALPSAKRSR